MAQASRTWWGQEFLTALERITDDGRLSRGRSYNSPHRIKNFEIQEGLIIATIRGNVNPYFGVYKEPTYITNIEFKPITRAKWNAAIALMGTKAGLISKLLLNEIPDNIDDAFTPLGLHFLPTKAGDFKAQCSCPDYSNPCKHIAGVYYRLADQINADPFLLFELRGLSKQELQEELSKSPLGQALAQEMQAATSQPRAVQHFYTEPETEAIAPDTSLQQFWQGSKPLPTQIEAATPAIVPAILIKKQGDFPAFWSRDNSFIEVMEELYGRIRSKNPNLQ